MQQAVLLRLAMIEATAAGATNSTHPPTLTSTRFILVALLNRPEEKPFISMVFADERLILQACSRECLLRTLRAWNPRGYSAIAFSRRAPSSAFSRRGSQQWARNSLHQQQALRKPLFFCKNNAEEKLFSPCDYCYANKVTPVAGVWWKLVPIVADAASCVVKIGND